MKEPEDREELEGEEEETTLADTFEDLSAAITDDLDRIKELTSDIAPQEAQGEDVGITLGRLALQEIAGTVLTALKDLSDQTREVAVGLEALEAEVFESPSRSALLPADSRLIVGALLRAYEFTKQLKNERAKTQDRVPETLELVTVLRHAYERALELVVEEEDPEAALAAIRNDEPAAPEEPETPET